ncbi:hypothetical protein M8J76_009079 [Diaphorina citri]|nr:hypothetical protein M8J75_004160 [Diaphorina citri]KAI5745194.1 hypothetical protein M8J76_009079 [Diaphorina citri]KAI5753265.1 hypothetical protein M8J77_025310 [Diaphorina citri]
MADKDVMPKVDLNVLKEKTGRTATDYMKILELRNLSRVNKLNLVKKRNTLLGSVLAGTVISIYAYSIFKVKQETFLDDFNEPLYESDK